MSRPAIGPFDVHPRMVDEMHVMHASRARRHAGEAGKTTVDMLDHLRRRGLVVLEHVLDQVNPAARRIEFVAEQHITWACCGAKAAMRAGANDALGFGSRGIAQLIQCEARLHLFQSHPTHTPAYIRPGPRMRLGAKLSLTPRANAASASGCASNTPMAGPAHAGAATAHALPPAGRPG